MVRKTTRAKHKSVSRRGSNSGVASRRPKEQRELPATAVHADDVSIAAAGPFVVGIGASAGGLQALKTLFDSMPSDTGVAFVIVTHQQPDRASLLPSLLARRTRMPVVVAPDGGELQPDHVYVSPPGVHLGLLNRTFHWMEAGADNASHLPIDYFFRSLARDQEERAICIVCSGTGTDGTLGLRAIKAHGGLVMVQDEASAQHPGMPHSAAATQLADYVLSPEQMPGQLGAYVRAAEKLAPARAVGSNGLAESLPKIYLLLRNRLGHDFSGYKQNTMQRRIERRMRVHQLELPSDYVRLLQSEPHELDLLFQELLISVTQFFRDTGAFDAFAARLAPLIEQASFERPVRVWVPGCATGEEPYSIAMLAIELAERQRKPLHLQIFATDVDPHAIEVARAGIYPASITADVDSERLKRHFVPKSGNYQIHKSVRDRVVFATHNLLRDPPFTKLTVLACRNLLIYLNTELQAHLFPLFHYALEPDALLWLGSAETATRHAELFTVLDREWRIYQRRKSHAGSRPFVDSRPSSAFASDASGQLPPSPALPRRSGIADTMERVLLERFAPATVVVGERGDIAYIHGRTGAYLEPSAGEPRHNLFAMAREGLRSKLQSAVRLALVEKREVSHTGIAVRTNGGFERVTVIAQSIVEPESLRGLVRVSFAMTPAAETSKRRSKPSGKPGKPRTIDELQSVRESLQATLDELQTSNEKLLSANEQLLSANEQQQSVNEELQSTNEELESSKEELQSLNEELQTVNAELQLKIEELAQVNDDMQNMLNGTDIATLFLDRELRIKRFTEQARRVVHLISSDVGRPISDLVSQMRYADLSRDAAHVLRTLLPHEIEVKTLDGRWLLVRMLPYRTGQNTIDGVVITFVDIDRVKGAEVLAASREFAERIVQTVREPLLVLDDALRIVASNVSFSRLVGLGPHDVQAKLLVELSTGEQAFRRLAPKLEAVAGRGETVEGFLLTDEFDFARGRRFHLYARRLVDGGVAAVGQVLIVLDETQGKSHQS